MGKKSTILTTVMPAFNQSKGRSCYKFAHIPGNNISVKLYPQNTGFTVVLLNTEQANKGFPMQSLNLLELTAKSLSYYSKPS